MEKFSGAAFPTPQQPGILDKRGQAVSPRANMMELQRRSIFFLNVSGCASHNVRESLDVSVFMA